MDLTFLFNQPNILNLICDGVETYKVLSILSKYFNEISNSVEFDFFYWTNKCKDNEEHYEKFRKGLLHSTNDEPCKFGRLDNEVMKYRVGYLSSRVTYRNPSYIGFEWRKNGVLHREGGNPAIEYENEDHTKFFDQGGCYYLENGEFYRENDLPHHEASFFSEWLKFVDGKVILHREGNPARITDLGDYFTEHEHYLDGKLHNENGPAIYCTYDESEPISLERDNFFNFNLPDSKRYEISEKYAIDDAPCKENGLIEIFYRKHEYGDSLQEKYYDKERGEFEISWDRTEGNLSSVLVSFEDHTEIISGQLGRIFYKYSDSDLSETYRCEHGMTLSGDIDTKDLFGEFLSRAKIENITRWTDEGSEIVKLGDLLSKRSRGNKTTKSENIGKTKIVEKKVTKTKSGNVIEYFKNGKRHREGDKPAIIRAIGTLEYYLHGKKHREGDKPAVVRTNGTEEYFINGKRHREGDKPAIIRANRIEEYYIHGKKVNK